MFARSKPRNYFYAAVEEIPGWLVPTAGHRTRDILSWQDQRGIEGNHLEIGVFCGKYFALMIEAALRSGGHALGIDTFQHSARGRIDTEMKRVFGVQVADAYTIWQCDSATVTPAEITAAIGAPRFISVDGAHDHESVLRDLELSEAVLSPDGTIAVDDFLNPKTLGVNQAVNAFFGKPRSVVPVAYISNKLFLTHAARSEDYRDAIEEMIIAGDQPQSAHFREMLKKSRTHIEQPFFGHRVILS